MRKQGTASNPDTAVHDLQIKRLLALEAALALLLKCTPSSLARSAKASSGYVTPDFPPRAIRDWPEGRTDQEACKVFGRADYWGAEGGGGGREYR